MVIILKVTALLNYRVSSNIRAAGSNNYPAKRIDNSYSQQ